MSMYWVIVSIVLILGIIIPQKGYYRKHYVILMTCIHTFVCAFRYQFLTGDLIKYNTEFRQMQNVGYFSEKAIHEWKNTGFYWLMKFIGNVTNGNYQAFLIALAVFTCVVSGVLIYRYSTKPWLSYLVWNCMNFYLLYDFLAIKQGLAMAFLMLAMICIFERKPIYFLTFTLIAGFVHMPALCFLPAYFIANRKVDSKLIIAYIASAIVIFGFRTQIVDMVGEIYYEENSFNLVKEELGGKVIVIVLILLAGFFLKGFREKRFGQLFNIIAVAAIFQMFSGFDNVFTRLADYYLQFTILFIPSIFYNDEKTEIRKGAAPTILPFNDRSIKIIVMLLVVILIWWYDTTCLGVANVGSVDNYLNYRFMWQVK